MNWENVGKRIRSQRERLGMTREALAEKLEVTPKFCSDIELGLKGMSVPTLCKLANVLSLSTDYILFGTKNEDFDCTVSALLRQCPPEKLCYIEDIIKLYIQATEQNS